MFIFTYMERDIRCCIPKKLYEFIFPSQFNVCLAKDEKYPIIFNNYNKY